MLQAVRCMLSSHYGKQYFSTPHHVRTRLTQSVSFNLLAPWPHDTLPPMTATLTTFCPVSRSWATLRNRMLDPLQQGSVAGRV